MSHRLTCCILVAAIALPAACRRDPPAAAPAAPPAPASTEFEGRLAKAEERLRRTEDALVKSQEAIRDLQVHANERPVVTPPVKPPLPAPPQQLPAAQPEQKITLAKFNAIQVTHPPIAGTVGMKYEEVVKVMGCEGAEKFTDGKTCIMAWDNDDGSGAKVSFVIVSNGRFATSKSQHGLR